MVVYYKFKSAKDFDSITIDGHFISVENLKQKIFEIKHLGRGTDFDLLVTNAQTNEEYLDEATLIPKNTSVLVRRVPGRPRITIVTEPEQKKSEEDKEDNDQSAKSTFPVAGSSARFLKETEWDDDFGNDLYAIPEVPPVLSNNMVQDAPPPNKADEDSKIKALVDTPALDWMSQTQEGFEAGRGFGRGMGGRMMGAGQGFGRGGFERKTPPPGYTCHRCKVPGHFIQHCPTNGDPNYDVRRVKPPTGIPRSMLMATPDGSYALPSGAVAVLKPNEAAFEKEIEGLPSTTRSVTDLPPELRCPLCKEVMKNAVLTSKCCFKSFCDKCIRDYTISKSSCICGATNVLADNLLPNKTLRDTINRILESNNGSAENAGSMLQIQDMESARSAPPKIPSLTISATSKGEPSAPVRKDEGRGIDETADTGKHDTSAPQQSLEIGKTTKVADVSQAKQESMSVKEPMPQGNARVAEDEAQQKLPACEPVKKKKKKKVLPLNAADLQWGSSQELAAENYMMSFAPSTCNPYWGGMQQLGIDGYMAPYVGTMPYMGGYVPVPFDVPLGGMNMIPQDPFGGQGYMMPDVPPQRDLPEFVMGSNQALPVMSREEFEARKADLRRKREMEHRGERQSFRDRESGREMSSSSDVSTMKSKSQQQQQLRPMPLPPISADQRHHRHHQQHHRSERPLSQAERSRRELEPFRLGKTRPESEPEPEPEPEYNSAVADKRHKASVFSRINFPEKKRKSSTTTTTDPPPTAGTSASSHHHHRSSSSSNGGHHHHYHHHHHHRHHRDENKASPITAVAAPPITTTSSSRTGKSYIPAGDQDSSDEEPHFKRRRPSRRYHEEERGHSKHR